MAPRTPVGIDLGTTFCVAARISTSGESEVLPLQSAGKLLPSLVHFTSHDVLVGPSSGEPLSGEAPQTVSNAKRRLAGGDRLCDVQGASIPAEVVLGYLLQHIRDEVAGLVGEDFSCVITVPAYFDDLRRQAVGSAGVLSGLDVLDIVNEPTAAALAFGEKLGYLSPTGAPSEAVRVIVYDLGGGTFDVTAIEIDERGLVTQATDGDNELGGLNWDEELARLIQERYLDALAAEEPSSWGDDQYWGQVANNCKRSLTDREVVELECEGPAGAARITISRADFEEATGHLTDRTLLTTRECLKAAGWSWADVDRLILVGGASRMPAVRAALRAESRLDPEDCIDPDEAVARGAAIVAQTRLTARGIATVAREIAITNVSSHSLGVVGTDMETLHKEVVHLIKKNSKLPCKTRRGFVTRSEDQRSVEVLVTEGESASPEYNQVIGKARVVHLPPGLPAGSQVNVTYSYDESGRLSISAEVPGAGAPAQLSLERERTLTRSQVSAWSEVVNKRGGYADFADAILSVLDDPEDARSSPPKPAPEATKKRAGAATLDAASEAAAPKAASERLKDEVKAASTNKCPTPAEPAAASPSRRVRHSSRGLARTAVNAAMLVVSSVVGLSIGYYVVCAVRPEANFLNLRLPGLPEPVMPQEPSPGP